MVAKMEKINARWEYGIFVGIKEVSNEVMVATKEGILHCRSVKRIPIRDRWTKDSVDWIRWAPWNRYKDAEDADGDVPDGVEVEEREEVPGSSGDQGVYIHTRNIPPRDFQITKEDADRHGYTRGCAGCVSWFKGRGRQPHTEECRERFRGLMRDDAKVRNHAQRMKEFEELEEERRRKKEERRKAREEARGSGGQPGSRSNC